VNRDDIVFEDKDQPLRVDVNQLGTLVGEMLREQGGDALFERVEAARRAAIRRRRGDQSAESELAGLVASGPVSGAAELVRGFSTYFRVVNRAEQIHRIRRRRDYDREPGPPPGSLRAALSSLHAAGVALDRVGALLARLSIEPVFTAHPTEATRRSILQKEQRIARLLLDSDDPTLTPVERATLEARIRMEVTAAWQTASNPAARPTVENEREHVLYYLLNPLYEIVPAFYESLDAAARAVYGEPIGWGDRPLVRFASWVGGDMDGNPNVSGRTIRSTLAAHRELILLRYRGELRQLADILSQSRSRVLVDEGVMDRIEVYGRELPEALRAVPERHREMPYRVLCHLMAARLEATRRDGPGAYLRHGELLDDLESIAGSLRAHRGRHAGLFQVERAIHRVRTFGFHLATLDVRQDSLVHREAVGELLGRADWTALSSEERTAVLAEGELRAPASVSPATATTLDVFHAIKECRARFGDRAVGPFIVSMTQGADDILSVLALAGAAGLDDPRGGVAIDAAPLFETVGDLAAARETMERLLSLPGYRRHLARRDGQQVVMIGYSDSAKDGGVVASRWALQQAQAELSDLARSRQVDLTLFHGRGGTVGRGGGKTHRAVVAAPVGSVNGRLRVTEQGEVIDAKYGLRGIAFRSLERMAGSVLVATGAPAPLDARAGTWVGLMDQLTAVSRDSYRSLVYEHPAFVPYFREATPIDVIERMAIGSRPPSRRSGKGIENLRAIPWVFAWTQSRHMLPGWYGLGTGLAHVAEGSGIETLAEMVREWPFLATLVEDVEMVLAKADLGIAARYASLSPEAGPTIFPLIEAEFQRTAELILRLRGTGSLLESDPTLRRSIQLRNPYVDPMSFLQIDLLRAWRAGGRSDEQLFGALLETVNGIAQGLQNTG